MWCEVWIYFSCMDNLNLSHSLEKSIFFFFNTYLFGCLGSQLCYMESFACSSWALELVSSIVVARGLTCSVACGILVPWPRVKPTSPASRGRFLTPGSPGKSPSLSFKNHCYRSNFHESGSLFLGSWFLFSHRSICPPSKNVLVLAPVTL